MAAVPRRLVGALPGHPPRDPRWPVKHAGGGRTRLGRDLDTTADLAFLLAAGASSAAAGRLPVAAGWALGARHAIGIALSLAAAFGRARRPAIRARPPGGALRIVGLALCAADRGRSGAAILVAGCCVPPRSTTPERSIA